MLPEMYILVNPHCFHLNIASTATTPAYPNKLNPNGASVPYTQEEKSTIDANELAIIFSAVNGLITKLIVMQISSTL